MRCTLKKRGHAHLVRHGKTVVRTSFVGTQGHRDAQLPYAEKRCDAVAKEGVGTGILHDAGAAIRDSEEILYPARPRA